MNRLKLYDRARTFASTEIEPLLNQIAEKALSEMKKVYKDEDDVEATAAFAEYIGEILTNNASIISDVMGDYKGDLEEYEDVKSEEESGDFPEEPADEEPAAAEEPAGEEGAAPEVPEDLASEIEPGAEEAPPELPPVEEAPGEEEPAPEMPPEEEEQERKPAPTA